MTASVATLPAQPANVCTRLACARCRCESVHWHYADGVLACSYCWEKRFTDAAIEAIARGAPFGGLAAAGLGRL